MMLSVVFRAGERAKSVTIPLVDDSVLEGPQSFTMELSPLSTGVTVDDTPARVVIVDNDGQWEAPLLKFICFLSHCIDGATVL